MARTYTWRSTTAPVERRRAAGFINIAPETLNMLHAWAKDLERQEMSLRPAMNDLTAILAHIQFAEALMRSRGVYDPYRQRDNYRWKIPVRRISNLYYRGWKVKHLGRGAWLVFNDSREAFFIEFGIHVGQGRVRRPINKLSLIWTLRTAEKSKVYEFIWDDVFMPRRGGRLGMTGSTAGHAYAGSQVQSPSQDLGGYIGGSF